MANYQRARDHEDDIDFIPLITVPAHEQDVTDQHLPTYDALDLFDQEVQRDSQRRAHVKTRLLRLSQMSLSETQNNSITFCTGENGQWLAWP
jgi:hypothetical protein